MGNRQLPILTPILYQQKKDLKTTDPRRKRRVNRDDFIAAGCTMSCPCRCYYCVNHGE